VARARKLTAEQRAEIAQKAPNRVGRSRGRNIPAVSPPERQRKALRLKPAVGRPACKRSAQA
jgi:hypothetical protein